MSGTSHEEALLSAIGMCRGAGRAVIGVPMICDALKARAVKLSVPIDGLSEGVIVIEASDTSDNTHKRICDRCAYYKIRHIKIESDCLSLGKAVGKSAVGAVMINDASFCRLIDKKLADMASKKPH